MTVCVRSTAARMGEYAVRYALRRAGYAPTEIRVLDSEQNVIEVVPAEDGRALVQAGKEIRARRRLAFQLFVLVVDDADALANMANCAIAPRSCSTRCPNY